MIYLHVLESRKSQTRDQDHPAEVQGCCAEGVTPRVPGELGGWCVQAEP